MTEMEKLRAAVTRVVEGAAQFKQAMARLAISMNQTSRAMRRKAETFYQIERNRYVGKQRRYYDPGSNPKPRKIITLGDEARIAKPTRQQRRAIEREQAKHKEQKK